MRSLLQLSTVDDLGNHSVEDGASSKEWRRQSVIWEIPWPGGVATARRQECTEGSALSDMSSTQAKCLFTVVIFCAVSLLELITSTRIVHGRTERKWFLMSQATPSS